MYKMYSTEYTELTKNYLHPSIFFEIFTVHAIQTDERVEVQLHSFLAVPLDEGEWSAFLSPSCSPSPLPPVKVKGVVLSSYLLSTSTLTTVQIFGDIIQLMMAHPEKGRNM
jgi:hypothetical protein